MIYKVEYHINYSFIIYILTYFLSLISLHMYLLYSGKNDEIENIITILLEFFYYIS